MFDHSIRCRSVWINEQKLHFLSWQLNVAWTKSILVCRPFAVCESKFHLWFFFSHLEANKCTKLSLKIECYLVKVNRNLVILCVFRKLILQRESNDSSRKKNELKASFVCIGKVFIVLRTLCTINFLSIFDGRLRQIERERQGERNSAWIKREIEAKRVFARQLARTRHHSEESKFYRSWNGVHTICSISVSLRLWIHSTHRQAFRSHLFCVHFHIRRVTHIDLLCTKSISVTSANELRSIFFQIIKDVFMYFIH